jgi:hypothetical protein
MADQERKQRKEAPKGAEQQQRGGDRFTEAAREVAEGELREGDASPAADPDQKDEAP